MGHTEVLAIAYGTACLLWLAVSRLLPYWRAPIRPSFEHPWREVGYALLAALLVIGLGQLWLRGVRLPNNTAWRPVFESINQTIIFSPMLLLLLWRRQPLASAWLPGRHAAPRLAIGLGLAVIALAIYTALERGAPGIQSVLSRVLLFAQSPELHCKIRQRICVGPYVVDEEAITGFHLAGFPTEVHAAAVYRVEADHIVHVRGLM